MRKIFTAIIMFTFLVSAAHPAYCGTPMRKLERGLCNVLTFYLEIYNQMQETANSSTIGKAATYGLAKGIYMSAYRAGAGIYEVFSFPFPCPRDYEPILKDPEFFFGSPDVKPEKK